MFIKLSKNRKKIRTAAIEKDWPVLGNDGDSDSDPKYEVSPFLVFVWGVPLRRNQNFVL